MSYKIRILLSFFYLLVLSACGGGSSGGGNSDPVADTPAAGGRVLLGPVINADIAIYEYPVLSSAILNVISEDHSNLEQAGRFSIASNNIDADALYLVVSTGGDDIDVDDNGQRDATPTPVSGDLHALVMGTQLLSGEWSVNLLTELAYQRLRVLLLEHGRQSQLNTPIENGELQVLDELDRSALYLVKEDVNNDGVINAADITAFNPREDTGKIALSDNEYQSYLAALLAGDDVITLASELLRSNIQSIDLPLRPGLMHLDDNNLYVLQFDPSTSDLPPIQSDRLARFDISGNELVDGIDTDVNRPAVLLSNTSLEQFGGSRFQGFSVTGSGDNIYVSGLFLSSLHIDYSVEDTVSLTPLNIGTPTVLNLEGDILSALGHGVFEQPVVRLSNFRLNDPTTTEEIGTTSIVYQGGENLFPIPLFARGVGDYLYVGRFSYGEDAAELLVFDNSIPSEPELVQSLPFPGSFVRDLLVIGDEAYALSGLRLLGESEDISNTLHRLDITNPAAPVITHQLLTVPYSVGSLSIFQNKLLLPTEKGFVLVLDVSNPDAPEIIKRLATPELVNASIVSDGEQIYASTETGILVLDNVDVEPLSFSDHRVLSDVVRTFTVDATGTAWLLFDDSARFSAVSLASSGELSISADDTLALEHYVELNGIFVRDDRAFISSLDGDFYVLDLSVAVPEVSHSLPLSGEGVRAGGFAVAGNFVFMSSDNSVAIIDITHADSAVLHHSLALDYQPRDVAIEGDLLYVFGRRLETDVIDVYNVSNVGFPLLAGRHQFEQPLPYESSMMVDNGIIYLAAQDEGLKIVDVTNPAATVALSSLNVDKATRVLIDGDNAYVATAFHQIAVFDITHLNNATRIATLNVRGPVQAMTVQGDYLLVSDSVGLVTLPALQNVSLP